MKFAAVFAIFALFFVSMAMSEPLEVPMTAGHGHSAGVDGDGVTKCDHGQGCLHRHTTTTTTTAAA